MRKGSLLNLKRVRLRSRLDEAGLAEVQTVGYFGAGYVPVILLTVVMLGTLR